MKSPKLDLRPGAADPLLDLYLASGRGAGDDGGLNARGMLSWYSFAAADRVDTLLDRLDEIGDSWFKAGLLAALIQDAPTHEGLVQSFHEVLSRSANFAELDNDMESAPLYFVAAAYQALGDGAAADRFLGRGDAVFSPTLEGDEWYERDGRLAAVGIFCRCVMGRLDELDSFLSTIAVPDGEVEGCEVDFDQVVQNLHDAHEHEVVPAIFRLQAKWGHSGPDRPLLLKTLRWMGERGDPVAQIQAFLSELAELAEHSDIQQDDFDPESYEYAVIESQPKSVAADLYFSGLREADDIRTQGYYLEGLIDVDRDQAVQALAWLEANLPAEGVARILSKKAVFSLMAGLDEARALEILAGVASQDEERAANYVLNLAEEHWESPVWLGRMRELLPARVADIRQRSGAGIEVCYRLWKLTGDRSWVPADLETDCPLAAVPHLVRRACELNDQALFDEALALLKGVAGRDRLDSANQASLVCAEHGKWAWEQKLYSAVPKGARQYWRGLAVEQLARQGLGAAAAELCSRRGIDPAVGLSEFPDAKIFPFQWELS